MLATINHSYKQFEINLLEPLDISIPITNDKNNVVAWYLDKPTIEPAVFVNFEGSVKKGASTNFNNISFNPHAHGTHTECLGHITEKVYSVNESLKNFFFLAEVITIEPKSENGDTFITKEQIENALKNKSIEALVIRTTPNLDTKKHKKYSNTNFTYMLQEAATYIREIGVKHLLIDLPSVDKELDEGLLLSHKAFWNVKDILNVNADARFDATITEMIFVDDSILDGDYFLNLQIASFENDASPSKPVLYKTNS